MLVNKVFGSSSGSGGGGGSSEDMLQTMVDQTNSCKYLFYYYGTANSPASLGFMKSLDTSNVTDMGFMFANSYVDDLDLSVLNTSKVTNMDRMFSAMNTASGELDVSSLDVSHMRDLSQMFSNCGCSKIILGSNFNISKAENLYGMLRQCKKITSIDISSFSKFGTYSRVEFGYLFYMCDLLETIVGELDLHNATSVSSMLDYCPKLTSVTLKNIKLALQIGSGTNWGHLLTVDTLVNTIKELWDYSSGTKTYKLTMGSANTAKLANVYVKLITPTAEQIEADPYIASKMPCEVCESTDEGAMLIEDYIGLKNWQIV